MQILHAMRKVTDLCIVTKGQYLQSTLVGHVILTTKTVIAQLLQTAVGRHASNVMGIFGCTYKPIDVIPTIGIALREFQNGLLGTDLVTEITIKLAISCINTTVIFFLHLLEVGTAQIRIGLQIERQIKRLPSICPMLNGIGQSLLSLGTLTYNLITVDLSLDLAVKLLQLIFQLSQLFNLRPRLADNSLQCGNLLSGINQMPLIFLDESRNLGKGIGNIHGSLTFITEVHLTVIPSIFECIDLDIEAVA